MISLFVLLVSMATAWAALPDSSNCGTTPITPNTKIVGGTEAKANSWPWMIQMQVFGQHVCGASLISSDWIVTAAHCMEDLPTSFLTFRAGRHYREGSESYEQIGYIKSSYIHESYNKITTQNDIALVRVRSAYKLTNQVRPVCLPSSGSSLPQGTMVYVTGWGRTTEGGEDASKLRQVSVPIVDRNTCNGRYYYNGRIKSGMICAGYTSGGKDACQNDSGGPMVAKVNGRWEQHGVVSWGDGCASAYKPGVYSDMVYFKSWIEGKLAQVEREELEAASKFQPLPAGNAFRQ